MAPGGAAVVCHVVDGTRVFALVPNTDFNRRLFVTWHRHARSPDCFMADYAEEPVLVEVSLPCMLRQGGGKLLCVGMRGSGCDAWC
jgi:hypothetical protein